MSLILDDLEKSMPAQIESVRFGTMESFKNDVIELSKEKTVLAYFTSPMNQACESFAALLEKYVRLSNGKAILVRFNIEDVQPIAMQLGIQGVPSTTIFANGQLVDGFSGVLSEPQLKQIMQALIGKAALSIDEMIKTAKEHLQNGEIEQSLQAFANVLEKDETNPIAFAGMIRCFIQMKELDAAQDLSDGLEDTIKNPELDAARTALKMAIEAKNAPNPNDLQQKVQGNPTDLQLRFDYANALFANDNAEQAIDELMFIIETEQDWNNDAAKQYLFKIFTSLGNANPITLKGRRKLSSLLFS